MRTMGRIGWILGLGVAVALVAGCEDDKSYGDGYDFGDNDPQRVLVLGDSIAQGYNLGGAQNYPSHLQGMTGKTVYNGGSGGATAASGASRVSGMLKSNKPGYLIIQYGSNDAIHGTDVGGSIGALRAMVSAAKANKTLPILSTVPPMTASHAAFAGAARELSAQIRALGGETGTPVADLEAALGDGSVYLQADGLHPTADGQRVIASVYAGILN